MMNLLKTVQKHATKFLCSWAWTKNANIQQLSWRTLTRWPTIFPTTSSGTFLNSIMSNTCGYAQKFKKQHPGIPEAFFIKLRIPEVWN